jgi:hypothetical protein
MTSEKPKKEKRVREARPGILLLWLLVLFSLLLNVVILGQLLQMRRTAQLAVAETSAILESIQDATFALSIPIEETIIIEADLPVDETILVPIVTELPISTTVTVPVDAGVLGEIPLNIPIEATVPINFTTDVSIDQTFAVRAPVALDLDVPVEIAMVDTPLYGALIDAQLALSGVAAQLEASPLQR